MLSVAIAPGSPTPPEHDLTRSVAAVVQAPVRAAGAGSGRERTTPHRWLCPCPRDRGPHGRMRWRRRRQHVSDDVSVRDPDHFERVGRANDFDGVRSAHCRGTAGGRRRHPRQPGVPDASATRPRATRCGTRRAGRSAARPRASPSRTRTTSSASRSPRARSATVAAVTRAMHRLRKRTPSLSFEAPARTTVGWHACRQGVYSTEAPRIPSRASASSSSSIATTFRGRQAGGRRPRNAAGRGQRRRVQAHDRELPVELTSLYREPEPAARAIEWPRPGVRRRVQALPLRARSRRSRCAVSIFGSSDASSSPCSDASGSGKSTFLHLAAGLDDAVRGRGPSVRAAARPHVESAELAAHRATHGRARAPERQPVERPDRPGNVVASLRLAGKDDAGHRADVALARFGLARRARASPVRLSGGEQQRVAIAAAAAREAPLVLADEPTGELDAGTSASCSTRSRSCAS